MNKTKRIIVFIAIIIVIFGAGVGLAELGTFVEKQIYGDVSTNDGGLEDNETEYGIETVEVTDANGQAVTDASGNTVTTDVYVKYETDKKGNTVAKQIGDNGEVVTNSKGKEVTVKTTYDASKSKNTTSTTAKIPTTASTKATKTTTMKNNSGEETTNSKLTTIDSSKDSVPKTSASGKSVKVSTEDQQTIKSMLEVPYLYQSSYENSNGVPINIASHAALWMAAREGLNTSSFASGTIVLDLFKYFGQTVVNFKTKCNTESNNSNIRYISGNDTFTVTNFESATHTVTIKSVQYLGNNNYYKVTASVSGCSKTKVVAIVQKNMLDSSLGFSIKALKWS